PKIGRGERHEDPLRRAVETVIRAVRRIAVSETEQMNPVDGAVCIVTGASRGLGERIAHALSARGARVAITGRDAQRLATVAGEMSARYGVEPVWSAFDLRDREAAAEFVADVEARLGTPSVLMNNAAILGPVGPMIDVDLAEWWGAIETNILGTASMTAAAGRAMAGAGRGVIVNISGGGVGGSRIAGAMSAYTTSKAAVVQLTETAAKEFEPHGVRVVAVAPGPFATDLTNNIIAAGPETAGTELFEAALRDRATEGDWTAFERMLIYVISPTAAWLTGRLLSARWETPESLQALATHAGDASLYRLRRVDGTLVFTAP
ncbi:MAG: SDR family oxidoreductase, partial [Betaproteobacteria bacterium]